MHVGRFAELKDPQFHCDARISAYRQAVDEFDPQNFANMRGKSGRAS
jgi:hypothetical protein